MPGQEDPPFVNPEVAALGAAACGTFLRSAWPSTFFCHRIQGSNPKLGKKRDGYPGNPGYRSEPPPPRPVPLLALNLDVELFTLSAEIHELGAMRLTNTRPSFYRRQHLLLLERLLRVHRSLALPAP
jgi:hypothetical protein